MEENDFTFFEDNSEEKTSKQLKNSFTKNLKIKFKNFEFKLSVYFTNLKEKIIYFYEKIFNNSQSAEYFFYVSLYILILEIILIGESDIFSEKSEINKEIKLLKYIITDYGFLKITEKYLLKKVENLEKILD